MNRDLLHRVVLLAAALQLGASGLDPSAVAQLSLDKAVATTATKPAPQPNTQVKLLADRSALVPGKSVDLAVAFEIANEWNIYWQNSGEGGMAPTFKWHLPDGFAMGPIRFPVPRRHVDALGAVTFILEGDPILLAELKVPSNLKAGQEVTIEVDARWVTCRQVCVIENNKNKPLVLKLPVVADAKDAKPANTDDFDYARGKLPLPPGKAKYLTGLRAAADVDRIQPGAKFRVAVVADIQKGFHLNSNKPQQEGLIPTDLFPYAVKGLNFDRPVFPPGKIEKSPIGDLSLYAGQAVVVLPIEADVDLKGKELRISGVLTYQACSDETKQCFPPTGVEWEVTLPIAQAGQTAQAANLELFREVPASQPAAAIQTSAGGGSWLQRAQLGLARLGIVGYLLMALIGGFILNLTPCVLPVISIKILSFVHQAREGRLRVFTLGLVFGLGIEVSFLVLGGIIMGLGQHLGISQQWGGQFQSPQVVIGLAAVVLVLALSLFGVFALNPPRVVNELGERVQREGHWGAFGMGLLATLLATACTAPFLSMVLAIAVRQPAAAGMLIFATAGAGMAFPYVLLAAQPAWIRLVPRPGPWMTTFEHVIGFLLLGMAVWLLDPLAAQIGVEGLQLSLVFLLLVAVAAWVYGRLGFDAPLARKLRAYVIIAVLVVGGWIVCFRVVQTIPQLADAQKALRMGSMDSAQGWSGGNIPWVPYARQRAMDAVEAGKTVFIDYTAQWCKNCMANEKFVLNTSGVREAMKRLGVVPFKADFTSFDPDIKRDLEHFGRSGVPMYVVIPAGRPDDPILLDEVITSASVIAALEKAGPSRPTASTSPAGILTTQTLRQ